ncbi:MAG: transcription termination factor NusA [bacterium]|nr:transcription termination factor NusA [bacterium]
MDISQSRSEFASALRQVCAERGIDPESVLETIKLAILAAYRKDTNIETTDDLLVEIDADSGELGIFREKENVTPAGFGRIASQTAKQVILQRIREAEKAAVVKEYAEKIGSIQSGMIQRFDQGTTIVDLGRAEGIMPREEQVARERYRLNQRLTFYISEIRETDRGAQIIVSRAAKELVGEIFKREVPEIASGAVEVKGIAREPGSRTKIAVNSKQSGVDPVGSCVGQKGVRVQAVISEIGEERVDVIQFSDDTGKFIAASLAPAKGVLVDLDKENRSAVVTCPTDQLSLAIGRDGQNVRLAVKLTGWKIDIKGPKGTEMPEDLALSLKEVSTEQEPEIAVEKVSEEIVAVG